MKRANAAVFFIFGIQMMICCAAHGEPSAPSPGAMKTGVEENLAQNGSDANASLHQLAPAEFFRKKKVEEQIDFQHIHHSLLSAAIFHQTNEKRNEHGKRQLGYLPRLEVAARMHARDMAAHEYVAHINPREQERRTPLKRVREAGLDDFRFVAENVASEFGIRYEPGRPVFRIEKDGTTEYFYEQGGEPIANHTYRSFAETLVDSWMNSPGHRENILSEKPEFLSAGCSMGEHDQGPVKFYCVQLFFARFP